MDDSEILKSRKSAPDTKSWFEYLWRTKQETPNRLEDAAKYLATMISISLSIFLAIGKPSFENCASAILKLSMVAWVLALVISFFVLFPARYRYFSESVQSIKQMHQKILMTKYILLVLSLVLFLFSLTTLTIMFFF